MKNAAPTRLGYGRGLLDQRVQCCQVLDPPTSGPSAISAASPATERPTKHLQPSFLSGRTVTTSEDASIFRPDSSFLQLPGQRRLN